MRLTTRRRYAVTAILDVSLHEGKAPVSLADIARRQRISQSYLEQLFSKLRRKGLVKSVRGPGGGYRLAKNPIQITVLEIINAIDEKPLKKICCDSLCDCDKTKKSCLTRKLWTDLSTVMYDFLNHVTLANLLHDHLTQNEKESSS